MKNSDVTEKDNEAQENAENRVIDIRSQTNAELTDVVDLSG